MEPLYYLLRCGGDEDSKVSDAVYRRRRGFGRCGEYFHKVYIWRTLKIDSLSLAQMFFFSGRQEDIYLVSKETIDFFTEIFFLFFGSSTFDIIS